MSQEAISFGTMTRWRASGIHLCVSLLIASLVVALLYCLWFPQPYFIVARASDLILIFMGVGLAIGPLLTLIVFSPRKPPRVIRSDLAVIVGIQIIALIYGVSVIFQERPVFVVGEVDRLVLVSARELSPADLAKARIPHASVIPWTGPRLVGVVPPDGPDAFDVIASAMKGGKDISHMPQYYVPYRDVASQILERAYPLEDLKVRSSRQRNYIAAIQHRERLQGNDLRFVPLTRSGRFFTAMIGSKDSQPVVVIDIDPWESGSITD